MPMYKRVFFLVSNIMSSFTYCSNSVSWFFRAVNKCLSKFKACKNSKLRFSSSCFIVVGHHMKIVVHKVVLYKDDILHLGDNQGRVERGVWGV